MSFKLFDQGYTAEEVSKMHKPTAEEQLQAKMNKWKESEQVLEVLRQIKGFPRQLDKMEAALWQKATKRR